MCFPKSYQKPLVCSYWNIQGYKSKIVGNKLNDPEFLKIISGSDIVSLAELHADKEVYIPGFKSIKQKIRGKLFKGPKIEGGIGVFVRTEISHLVQAVPNKNNDSIWIKLKKSYTRKERIYILAPTTVVPRDIKTIIRVIFLQILTRRLICFRKKG